ncbi:7067_t:CDS:1, partial [Acaulospora colombiana]
MHTKENSLVFVGIGAARDERDAEQVKQQECHGKSRYCADDSGDLWPDYAHDEHLFHVSCKRRRTYDDCYPLASVEEERLG